MQASLSSVLSLLLLGSGVATLQNAPMPCTAFTIKSTYEAVEQVMTEVVRVEVTRI